MSWLVPLLVFGVTVYAMGETEENHPFWSAFICVLGGIATFVAILWAHYQSMP